VTVIQNSASSKQSARARSSCLLTALSAQREPEFLVANDNPIRIGILSDQRESKGLASRSLPLEPSPSSLPWLLSLLIANLELEFRASARKQTADPKSNRKYSQLLRSPWRVAISNSGARRVHPVPIPCSADCSRGAYILIGTLGISENKLSCTKERRKRNPNRDKIAFAVNSAAHAFSLQRSAAAHRRQIISASAPLSSAPNLAIIDFPSRGHL
jgi:hypothetical protein